MHQQSHLAFVFTLLDQVLQIKHDTQFILFRKAKVLLPQMVSACQKPSRFLLFAGLDLQKADRGQSGAGTHKHKQVFKSSTFLEVIKIISN